MYRKRNYVMAGVQYGIGTMAPETEKAIIDSQISAQDAESKKRLTYAALGAGIGYMIAKDMMGALVGGAIGYFATSIIAKVATVEEEHNAAQEPAPETPSAPDTSPAQEDSF